MKYRVVKKQPNSKKCLVCGVKNRFGLNAEFYEMENKELIALFTPNEEHQSYPNRLHGGIASAILDETIGRAIMIDHEDAWGVTVELSVRFKKPIPLNEKLKVMGRITSDKTRIFEGTGEIILQDGEVAATASGRYMKMRLDKIADFDEDEQEWRVINKGCDPVEI
jgi:uncharacterized protein (TIGR00369 family)